MLVQRGTAWEDDKEQAGRKRVMPTVWLTGSTVPYRFFEEGGRGENDLPSDSLSLVRTTEIITTYVHL